jgi:predicted lipid-binding transport protein (Tim44 family)
MVRAPRLRSRQHASNAAAAQPTKLDRGTGAAPNEQPLSRVTMASSLGGALAKGALVGGTLPGMSVGMRSTIGTPTMTESLY